jgi:hypothetical protein
MAKMEHEERSKGLAEYIERWNNGVLEVMVYSGTMKVTEDWIEKARRSYPEIPFYQRILVLPLPPDFDWTKPNLDTSKPHLPNSILVMEDKERYRRKGRKKTRPLFAFLDRPGSTTVKEVSWTGKIGNRSKAWISEERFKAITKRNLYVDKFYADQIFSRGKDNSGL